MEDRKKMSIDEYEIGNQKKYDILDFYMLLRDSKNKAEINDFLLFPILCYCIDIINKTKNLKDIKLKVGIDKNGRIYAAIGREMYDYLFLGEKCNLDNVEIEFNLGKENFLLTSVNSNRNEFEKKSSFKRIYEINPEEFEKNAFLQKKKTELVLEEQNQLNEFIQNKKNFLISKFLKGYSHQESILKSFEGKIKGYLQNLPNLIFKKSNKEGKTIEEIDQIYLIKLENEKLTIDGFNYFYLVKYLDGKKIETKIFPNGNKLELVNNNLYFLEIKNSINGLILDYDRLKNIEISQHPNQRDSNKIEENENKSNDNKSKDKKIKDKNSKDNMSNDKKSKSKNSYVSFPYKRDELTGLGNTILTFDIFNELIREILENKEKECNLLYIVDSDFEKNMINTFKNCLERDEIIIKDLKLSFNLYLIYTQPDLALTHFIKENWEKKNQINLLFQKIEQKDQELKLKNIQIEKQTEEIKKQTEEIKKLFENRKIEKLQYKPISFDKSIIDFVKNKIQNKNIIVLIGLYEKFNNNETYIYTSLDFFQKMNIKEELTLVDFKTFNKVEQEELDNNNNESFFKCIIEDYKDKMKYFNWFNEIYIMVDLIFLLYISAFKEENIFEKFDIILYMIKQNKFIIHLKKENFNIQLITINNDECENPLFKKFENHEKLQLFEIEQFARNYINLLHLRNFFEKEEKDNKLLNEKLYLFDLKGRINYILDFCKNVKNNKDSKNCFILIIPVKEINNIIYDKTIETFVTTKNYKNVIIVRKTEFGNSFSKEELFSILKYNFNIGDDIEYDYRITWKEGIKNLDIIKKPEYIKLIEYNNILPICIINENIINIESMPLIEYSYFLFLPLLIDKISKPKVLIISDDYGILNNFYKRIYGDKLDITFYSSQKKENEEKFNKEIKLENNDKINVKSGEEAFKQLKAKKELFDIIIFEKIFNENKDEISIPSIKDNYGNLLNSNGIFSLNLRSCSSNEHNKRLKNIKKKFKNVKIINFRLCSDFLICSNGNNLKLIMNSCIKYSIVRKYDFHLPYFVREIGY